VKGGEKMATMVNIIPMETKQSVSPQSTSKKDSITSDKSAVGFAKLLNNQADKNQKDDANTKEDTSTAQSIMAMLGMALPVAANAMKSNQNNSEIADNLVINDSKVQSLDSKVQSPDASLLGKANTGFDVTIGMNTSKNQLAALLTKMTDTKAAADNNQVGQFTQVQLQELLQGKQLTEQVQVTDIPSKQVDSAINNALLGPLTSAVAMDNTNGIGKNNNTQLDNKKAASGTVTTADITQLVGTVDTTKPVIAPQTVVNVVDATSSDSKASTLLLSGKEQLNAESILPDQTAKNTDMFASLLNQQVVKNESQFTVTDAKQVAQQPVSDPYNVASQIVDQARLVDGQKNTEMIIQLKPEHLGELTLKVTVENGAVSASFHSNNSEVRNIIEASLPQLKQDLSNQGLKIENVGVYAGLGEFFSNGQHRESQGKFEVKIQNKKTEEDFLEALESTSSIESSVDGSGVDYRI
jgi:flagellar hook-length control protein FliK